MGRGKSSQSPERIAAANGEAILQEHADRINTALERSVEAILDAGRRLILAKRELPHGQWERLFQGHPDAVNRPVPFSVRTAQMLMAVAEHPLLSKANHGSFLPPSWRTLYELTRWSEPVLAKALTEGRIHPGMERQQVRRLHVALTSGRPTLVRGGLPTPMEPLPEPAPAGPEPLLDQLDEVYRDLQTAFRDLDRDEQLRIVERLRQIASDLEGQIRDVEPATEPEIETDAPRPVSSVVEDEARPIAPVVKSPAAFVCQACQRELSSDEVIVVRECPQCEDRFDGTENGRNCPNCNRPFSRLVADEGCPYCLDECDEIEDESAAETPA